MVPGGVVTHNHEADEESGLPFPDNTFDLAVSSLRLGHTLPNGTTCICVDNLLDTIYSLDV